MPDAWFERSAPPRTGRCAQPQELATSTGSTSASNRSATWARTTATSPASTGPVTHGIATRRESRAEVTSGQPFCEVPAPSPRRCAPASRTATTTAATTTARTPARTGAPARGALRVGRDGRDGALAGGVEVMPPTLGSGPGGPRRTPGRSGSGVGSAEGWGREHPQVGRQEPSAHAGLRPGRPGPPAARGRSAAPGTAPGRPRTAPRRRARPTRARTGPGRRRRA